jgi:hypothetical protein
MVAHSPAVQVFGVIVRLEVAVCKEPASGETAADEREAGEEGDNSMFGHSVLFQNNKLQNYLSPPTKSDVTSGVRRMLCFTNFFHSNHTIKMTNSKASFHLLTDLYVFTNFGSH